MTAPFLALITPIGGSEPPLSIWGPTDPRPTPPVAGPGRPPWWGMAQDPGYGVPLPPLGTWGPNDPRPTPPVAGPGRPPWWGMAQDPGYGVPLPQPPLIIWGPGDPRPTLPISGWDPTTGAWPKPLPPEIPNGPKIEWKAIWTPQTGWAVIGIPTGPTPTPSK